MPENYLDIKGLQVGTDSYLENSWYKRKNSTKTSSTERSSYPYLYHRNPNPAPFEPKMKDFVFCIYLRGNYIFRKVQHKL